MKPKHTIALAQVNPTVGDLHGNAREIIRSAHKARDMGADIVVFPEQVVTGYPAQDLLLHEDFIQDVQSTNDYLARNIKGITAIVGSVEPVERAPDGKRLRNVALVMQDGKILDRASKTHLPTYDVFYEKRYFTPSSEVAPILIDGAPYGIQICEDMWDEEYERKISKELVAKGAKALINISASPYYLRKHEERLRIIRRHAKENKVPFLYVNMVGGQDELIFDGNSLAVSDTGEVIAHLAAFEEDIQMVRFPSQPVICKKHAPNEEELFNALALGLREYVKKSGFTKVVLGLSGGIDSALTAAIAVHALGKNNVKGFALPSQFNSSHAHEDAKALARALGIEFDTVPIAGMYDSILKEMARTFKGKPFDVTEENIQARLRMILLMSHANKHNQLLLSTGDKSEVALGYCTIYGDMSGALSVISDLTKPEVYAVARWYNARNRAAIIPERTITKPASPELSPGQVAPFDYDRLSPLLEQLTQRVPLKDLHAQGYTPEEIRTSYHRWRRSEFKRWQAPIALKCKRTSFGRGRLYPVTNHWTPSKLCAKAIPPLTHDLESAR